LVLTGLFFGLCWVARDASRDQKFSLLRKIGCSRLLSLSSVERDERLIGALSVWCWSIEILSLARFGWLT